MQDSSYNLSREWQAFWLAVGFLTRIPMLARIDYSQRLMNQSSLYFPLVGLLLGAIYSVTFSVLQLWFAPVVCILLVITLHLWITGAFHEDGLADSVDALGGGYTVEKRLAIMKDSRIGTYGTVALVMALGLKAALLLETPTVWLALLLAPAVSRLTPLLLMGYLAYVTDTNQSKSKPVADGFSRKRLMLAAAFTTAVATAASFWHHSLLLWCLLATLGVALLWGRYLRSQLGGYTGDTLGASVVLSELVLLLLLSV
ncbi:adenosylcobinamide-GDP ribazoletransferase [Marinobacter lacisalsi]|uniref:Adenosylcobinamide-GDP ribazoletransferase n=1 Tax=Marinobacter lacisalsi TaxID=475979 RepID=A0ABV8QJL6_9GAMM